MLSSIRYVLAARQGKRYVFFLLALVSALIVSENDCSLSGGQTEPLDGQAPQFEDAAVPVDAGDAGTDGNSHVSDADVDASPPDADTEQLSEVTVDRNLQLALARICVSEAGFQLRTRDCEFIYHVLRTRSRSNELNMGTMRSYCTKSFNRHRTDRHRWVPHLTHTFSQPVGWGESTSIPWSRRRQSFQEVYEFAGQIIHERPDNPCDSRLDHWGARGFRQRHLLRSGWTIVDCGETLNTFWSLPGANSVDPGVN